MGPLKGMADVLPHGKTGHQAGALSLSGVGAVMSTELNQCQAWVYQCRHGYVGFSFLTCYVHQYTEYFLL